MRLVEVVADVRKTFALHTDRVWVVVVAGHQHEPRAADRLGAEPVVVVSHDYWTQRLGADLEIVGRTVMQSEAPHVVIGVMPPGFRFPGASYFWIPVGTIEEFRDPENYDLRGIARMSEGLDLNSARVEGEYIVQRLAAEFPSTKTGLRTGVRYLRDEMVPVELVQSSLALVLGVLFFVVLACSNLGHLAVVRALGRAVEFLLRYRLGASRSRLARQLAAEGIVLATAAAALAALVAIWVQRLIGGLIPDDLASALSVVVAEPALGAGGASVAAVLWILIALLAGWTMYSRST